MAKNETKKEDFQSIGKKQEFEYTVTARLVCGECGRKVYEIVRYWVGDYALDLTSDDVQDFFLNESIKEFDGDQRNGDFVILEMFDRQNKNFEVVGFGVEDDGDDDSGCPVCFEEAERKKKMRKLEGEDVK